MKKTIAAMIILGLSLTTLVSAEEDGLRLSPERTKELTSTKIDKSRFLTKKPLKFTMPQIDLNNRQDMQVIISRYKDMYCAHPGSVLLEDGKTMTIMYLNHHGRGFLYWKRSLDAGKTWTEHLPVPSDWDVSIDGTKFDRTKKTGTERRPRAAGKGIIKPALFPCGGAPTLYRMKAPDGKERVFVYMGRPIVRYAVSEDGGATWSKMIPLLFDGKFSAIYGYIPVARNRQVFRPGLSCIKAAFPIQKTSSMMIQIHYGHGFAVFEQH